MYKKTALFISVFLFHPSVNALTLQEAVDKALKQSPSVLIRKEKKRLRKEEKRETIGKSLGKIDAVGSYTKYNLPRTLSPITPPITPDITTSKIIKSMGIKYDVMLFSGFSDLRSIEIAKLAQKESEIEFNLTKEELIYNVKSLFFKILTLKEQKKAALSYKKALSKLYEDTKKEVKLGKKAQIDLLKVASDLENANYGVVNIENSIKILKSKLASLIGEEKIDKIEKTPYFEKKTPDTDIKETLIYKKALLESEKSEKNAQKAKALYYPKLSLNAYYGKNFASGDEKELWQTSVNLNIPIFDFGNRKSKLQKAKISEIISKLKLKSTALKLKSDLEEADKNIQNAKEKIKALKKQLLFLKKIKETEKIKYQNGVSDMYDLLYAIAKYNKAKSDLISSKYDLKMKEAYLNYLKAGEK